MNTRTLSTSGVDLTGLCRLLHRNLPKLFRIRTGYISRLFPGMEFALLTVLDPPD